MKSVKFHARRWHRQNLLAAHCVDIFKAERQYPGGFIGEPFMAPGNWIRNMSMSTRTSLWTADINKNYWHEKTTNEAAAEAEHRGEPVAEKLVEIFDELPSDERNFIEFLVLSGVRKIIAEFEVEVLKRLVSKDLLQLRPGVGTRFMHAYQTSFSIPDAIWDALHEHQDTLFELAGQDIAGRILDLRRSLGKNLDGVVPIKS
jgi:hypothetical protein